MNKSSSTSTRVGRNLTFSRNVLPMQAPSLKFPKAPKGPKSVLIMELKCLVTLELKFSKELTSREEMAF